MASRSDRSPWWAELSDEKLLDVRLENLGLRVEGSVLEERVARLCDELDRAGMRFRPDVWLSTDWFSPHGIPGFAVPFFLAHPRLARLERRQMIVAEGANHGWCMKLLRHEAGLSLAEIADTMSAGAETVKSRLRYAMERLRAAIARECLEH